MKKMQQHPRILAVIPARGGSKGIPRKNLAPLGEHPLIGWTIAAALGADGLDRVLVSTDDEEIARTAREYGAQTPFLRPPELSGDTASALQVIRHTLEYLAADEAERFDAVAYLQPTSPFRRARHVSEAIDLYDRLRPDTLVSVQQAPHNMTPSSLMRPLAGAGEDLMLETPSGKLRRQEKEVLYARNGPAILICSVSDLLSRARLYGDRVAGYPMDAVASHDIDEPMDLDIARCLLPLSSFA